MTFKARYFDDTRTTQIGIGTLCLTWCAPTVRLTYRQRTLVLTWRGPRRGVRLERWED